MKYRNKILCIDAQKGLEHLPDKSIDCIITSPPYWNLRDYGIKPSIWDADKNCNHNWESHLKKGISGGKKSSKVKIKDQENFQIVPDTQYKICTKCNAWKGCLGLEPSVDLYIKHLCDIFEKVKRVLKATGTVWVNLGDTYKEKCLQRVPQKFSIEMIKRGFILRNEIIWKKPNAMPESATDRFTNNFEYVYFFTKKKDYYFNQQFEPLKDKKRIYAENHPNLRKDYENHNVSMQSKGQMNFYKRMRKRAKKGKPLLKNKRAVWEISTKGDPAAHFATFNEDLITPPIKAGCPKYVCSVCGTPKENGCNCNESYIAGIVLDPFAGLGKTLITSWKLGRDYLGFEIGKKYIEIARKRLKKETGYKRLDSFLKK